MQAVGNSLYSLRPDSLVELGVQADVGGAHRHLRTVRGVLDSPGSAPREREDLHALVHVDAILASDDGQGGRVSSGAVLSMQIGR